MSILEQIYQYKINFVENQKKIISQDKIKKKITTIKSKNSDFYETLKAQNDKVSIIGEIKRASPSLGKFVKDDINIIEIAKAYEKNNISCLSVLTDEEYFNGNINDLIRIKASTNIPILRKDFIVDEYQIYESKLCGADCILIILSMINEHLATKFAKVAEELNMDSIIEVHNIYELEIAKRMNSKMIGINNRNLKNFVTDLNTTIELAKKIGDCDKLLISESGFHSKEDIDKIKESTKINNFLIGEFLMKSKNLQTHINKLLT